jgi:hypothetical protein
VPRVSRQFAPSVDLTGVPAASSRDVGSRNGTNIPCRVPEALGCAATAPLVIWRPHAVGKREHVKELRRIPFRHPRRTVRLGVCARMEASAMSLHDLLISLHAAAGTIALLAGTVAIWRPNALSVYLIALIVCILLLAGAIADDWDGLGTGTRALYLVLTLLGCYMIWCGTRALALRRQGLTRSRRYLDRLGFTLVALLDAFAIILVLSVGAPIWAIVLTGVAVAAAGHRAIAIRKRTLRPAPGAPARGGHRLTDRRHPKLSS